MSGSKLTSLFLSFSFLLGACAPSTKIKMKDNTTVNETDKTAKEEMKKRGIETENGRAKYTGPKKRIGVVSFENKAPYAQARIGNTATDILITELTKSGRFIVVEREKLDKLFDEQKMGQTGAIDANTAAQAGKVLGLNALVTGSISQFGVKKEGKDFLVTQSKQQIVECTVDVRVVDAETGQVLYADSGKGVARKASGTVLGMGNQSKYDETLEGEALRAAIVKFVDNIILQVGLKPWSCRVAAVEDGTIYLNAGQESNIEVGQKLKMFSQGKEIKDPTTGLVLGRTEKEIGTLKVASFFGENGSVAELVSGAVPQPGFLCRLTQ